MNGAFAGAESMDKRPCLGFMRLMFRRLTFASPRVLACCAAVTVSLISTTALAGGYFVGPIGGQAVGRGGAFVAKANDLSAAYYNPAGFALMKGTRLQLDNKFSYNDIQFQREPIRDAMGMVTTAFAPVSNEPKFQPLDPLVGVATDFGLSKFAFGLVAYANSGISKLQFPENGSQRYLMTERNGLFINYALNAAWRPTSNFAVGVNLQAVVVPELTYQLVVNGQGAAIPTPSPVQNQYDILATVKGKDMFTPNLLIGAWYQPIPQFELGFSAQVLPSQVETTGPISMRFTDPNITFAPPTTLRNNLPADDVSIILPLPMWAKLGGRYVNLDANGTERFDVELDVTYERWSSAERFTVDSRGLMARAGANTIPVGVINVEKQWQDVIAFNLGGDYALLDSLKVRAGAYYETAVSKPEYTNVDFTTGQQVGLTAGGTFTVGGFSASLAYEFRTQPAVTTTTASGQVSQVIPVAPTTRVIVNGGTYTATSHNLALGLAYRF